MNTPYSMYVCQNCAKVCSQCDKANANTQRLCATPAEHLCFKQVRSDVSF